MIIYHHCDSHCVEVIQDEFGDIQSALMLLSSSIHSPQTNSRPSSSRPVSLVPFPSENPELLPDLLQPSESLPIPLLDIKIKTGPVGVTPI